MPRSSWILAAPLLAAALVVAFAAFTLVATEREVLAATEAEGRALLASVSAGVERSLEANRAVERLLAKRLLDLARTLGEELAERPGQEERLLRRFAREHRLKGGLYLDRSLRVVATSAVPPPIGSGGSAALRVEPLKTEDLVRRARERGLGGDGIDEVIVGFGENPFGANVEFLVAARVKGPGGWLLFTEDARELESYRDEAGVERVLDDATASDAIAYLLLQNAAGVVVAASPAARIGETLPPPAPSATWEDSADGRVLDVAIPTDVVEIGGSLRVGLAAGPVEAILDRARTATLAFSAIALLVGLAGSIGLARVDRARRLKEAEHVRELERRARAVELGRMAAGVAHEVRSPLNAIGMASQRLQREVRREKPDLEAVAEIAGAFRAEVERLNRTVEEFLDLGRERSLRPASFDLAAFLDEIVEAEAPEARRDYEPSPLAGDREELRKAVANLVRNARQAAGSGDAVVVAARRAAGGGTTIEVRDAGPGIPLDERERVFEHFATGRREGTGLGLAIARAVVERHGGRLTLDDAPEGGARFTISLPPGEPAPS